MTASVVDQTGAGEEKGPNNLYSRLVGESNHSTVSINGEMFECLIDTGANVSLISESALSVMAHRPEVKPLENLGLEISAANGAKIDYVGYVECTLSVDFQDSNLVFNVK